MQNQTKTGKANNKEHFSQLKDFLLLVKVKRINRHEVFLMRRKIERKSHTTASPVHLV